MVLLILVITNLHPMPALAAEETTEVEECFCISDIEKYDHQILDGDERREIVITDQIEIKDIAEKQGFPDVEKIKKLTFIIGEIKTDEINDNSGRYESISVRTFIGDISDCGTGYTLSGHFDENRYQGPISGRYTYTRVDNSSYNSTISIGSDIVSTGVGFTIGQSYSKTDSVSVYVPSGKRIILKIWTNYQKKSFTVYQEYSSSVGLWYPVGTGNAYKPVGLIFTQAEY